MSTTPAPVRYQVQTRSGLEWGWYAGSHDIDVARRYAREARSSGHRVRILDTTTHTLTK